MDTSKKARPGSTLANLAGHQGLPVGKHGKHFASKGSPPRTVAPRFADWKQNRKAGPTIGSGGLIFPQIVHRESELARRSLA